MPVTVASAAESAERDRAAIESGTPSRVLMQRAGSGAAGEIVRRFGSRLHAGVVVFTGAGNNGGDGWVVAGHLARSGTAVTVVEAAAANTPDAIAEREAALAAVSLASDSHGDFVPGVVVDALLGTGFRGTPRGAVQASITRVNALKQSGSPVASLDLPSGLDATTGEHGECVRADLTLSFGGIKRGTLLARDCSGEIVVIDIGLDGESHSRSLSLPVLIDRAWVDAKLPILKYDSHKGAKKHLAVVGGGKGMAGAPILAARGALRSGIGIVRAVVCSDNTNAVSAATPAALVLPWPKTADEVKSSIASWADAIVVGPGMGKSDDARGILDLVLSSTDVPLVIDADALNLFEGNLPALRDHLRGRKTVITPHVAEFARLAGTDVKTVLAERFDIGRALASDLGATVLLKGTPSVIFAPDGERLVSARGTAALGTGGSGDVLAGIVGTLLAQTEDPPSAAACAAWIHGRASELCEYVRGTTLEDVLYALPRAWNERELPVEAPVLARLPAAST
jgi:NAD(P)H-hydrate epimerase